jgi:hypothetical protein
MKLKLFILLELIIHQNYPINNNDLVINIL